MLRSLTTAAISTMLLGGIAHARTLEVGPGKQYATPSEAAGALADGDTIAIYPGRYVDCAVIGKNGVTIEGVGAPEQVVMTERACERKALLVIRGENATVRNLSLTNVRIADENGAGIRGESRSILVDRVRFVGNQNGILSGTVGGSMTIRDSLFDGNGFCGAACSHGIYVGRLDRLRVENSRFVDTRQGHHIKSRAARTEITGCDIQDGPTGTASYEIDAPNGGDLIVRNNTITKGPRAENRVAAIMIGAEGVTHPTREIVVADNTFRNAGDYPTTFVDNRSTTPAQLTGNRLVGQDPVRPLKGSGTVAAGR